LEGRTDLAGTGAHAPSGRHRVDQWSPSVSEEADRTASTEYSFMNPETAEG